VVVLRRSISFLSESLGTEMALNGFDGKVDMTGIFVDFITFSQFAVTQSVVLHRCGCCGHFHSKKCEINEKNF